MKKLLLIGNPSVLGKNLENILKQNYNTDFISTVPKQIGSISFNSYNALILDFTLEYYGAAEPPVRCGESHLSGLTEPLRSL